MPALDNIDTIVIVMMENRSFDHVLGHLHHPEHGNRPEIAGLTDPAGTVDYDNYYDNQVYKPFVSGDVSFKHDLPHERASIATQIDVVGGQPTMGGFVTSFVQHTHSVVQKPPPLAFLRPSAVPISSFLAAEYTVCNYWYSPLPTGTQPNRAVAFTGTSLIDDNVVGIIPTTDLVVDWLNRHQVRWRVYHSGLSFFLLFGTDDVLGENFRSIRHFARDLQTEPPSTAPQIIFIEPAYVDSPVHFGYTPNDNHPPLAMGPGEAFLESIYTALTKVPERWARTLLLVTYDEHGGFYDHVEPMSLSIGKPPGARYQDPFTTTGVRVPTFIISPWVDRASTCDVPLDHTSILQLLAEKFASGPTDYSAEVNKRRAAGIMSASVALTRSVARSDRPQAKTAPIKATSVLERTAQAPRTTNQRAFTKAARKYLDTDSTRAMEVFPELALLPADDEGE